jgi:hypothetical protein
MDTSTKLRKLLFQVNAGFLMLMGGVFAVLDYVGYRTGEGPLGEMLHGNTLAVGMQEAHGLAFLFGLTLFFFAILDARRSWHWICAGIHILLGGSNLLYWSGIVEYGVAGPEVVVTSIHGLFVLLHILSLFVTRNMAVVENAAVGNRSIP